MHRFLLIALILIWPAWCWALTGKVLNVAGGDTITILTAKKSQVKVRLYGIDTPRRARLLAQRVCAS